MTDLITIGLILEIIYWIFIWVASGFLYYIVLMELNHFFGGEKPEDAPWWLQGLCIPFLLFWDFPLNITVFTVICWDLPNEFLITKRMRRYRAKYYGKCPSELKKVEWWRAQVRTYICDRHLDKYDSFTGDHC